MSTSKKYSTHSVLISSYLKKSSTRAGKLLEEKNKKFWKQSWHFTTLLTTGGLLKRITGLVCLVSTPSLQFRHPSFVVGSADSGGETGHVTFFITK
ncbi:hypothetical protein F8M41_025762 [Gigaspora margarita]|uniref:Uncharacterized protein n=1 Tax=Gigaspora margarita TaxID=4874 RepID=A0A8H3XJL9_GIGMA|nr:hypothetical protein F8M41_025762 [Gigaspora margarita]